MPNATYVCKCLDGQNRNFIASVDDSVEEIRDKASSKFRTQVLDLLAEIRTSGDSEDDFDEENAEGENAEPPRSFQALKALACAYLPLPKVAPVPDKIARLARTAPRPIVSRPKPALEAKRPEIALQRPATAPQRHPRKAPEPASGADLTASGPVHEPKKRDQWLDDCFRKSRQAVPAIYTLECADGMERMIRGTLAEPVEDIRRRAADLHHVGIAALKDEIPLGETPTRRKPRRALQTA